MIKLMASVASLADSRSAIAGGAHILDIAEQQVFSALLSEGRQPAADLAVRWSLDHAGEDAPDLPATLLVSLPRSSPDSIEALDEFLESLAELSSQARVMARIQPSHPASADLVERLSRAGCAGVLLDSGETDVPRLFDHLTIGALRNFIEKARTAGLLVGLGGALEAPDIPRLKPLAPDFLRFGSALRSPVSEVELALDEALVRAMVGLLAGEKQAPAPILAGAPDRIIVDGLVVSMGLGAYAREHGHSQRVRFDVVVELASRRSRADDMSDIFSYDVITDAVAELAASGHVVLVETLAEALAARILQEPRALKAVVRVTKLDLGPTAMGIEITRIRSEGSP